MAVDVTVTSTTKEDLKKELDAEIDRFEAWFSANIENTNLHPVESSILRTYLLWKARPPAPNVEKTVTKG
jgi:hypothetical protein